MVRQTSGACLESYSWLDECYMKLEVWLRCSLNKSCHCAAWNDYNPNSNPSKPKLVYPSVLQTSITTMTWTNTQRIHMYPYAPRLSCTVILNSQETNAHERIHKRDLNIITISRKVCWHKIDYLRSPFTLKLTKYTCDYNTYLYILGYTALPPRKVMQSYFYSLKLI